MTAIDIARKDLADAIRSRALWFATAIFTVLMSLTASIPAFVFDDPSADVGVAFTQGPAVALVLPIIAIMLGYRSIVGERERGSIKFLLSLPHSRRNVIVGKLLGRSAVLAIAISTGFLVAGGLITALYGVPPIGTLLTYALLTVLAGTTFVAVAVGVSAFASTSTRAMAVLVGGYVTSVVLWERLLTAVHYVVAGDVPGDEPPGWVQLATVLNPTDSYSAASTALLPETPHVHFDVSEEGLETQQGSTVAAPESVSVFAEPWFAVAVLFAWILLPTVVGYLWFREAELN
ncbi:ABC transporter permease [Natrononativus amylolyticus]|uniref:ABC transporter permease n=1 Tax=Natrononativus amylolyticus TaxID=2963434 RepID=UPI0020CEB47E|nr:ABC transporter permease [Natrononativus amylolyticus]